MSIASPLCRVAIRVDGNEFDLIAALDTPIHVLLPAVLDLIANSSDTWVEFSGTELQLARCGAAPFDSRRSLAECGVHDGDLLALVPKQTAPRRSAFDICTTVREVTHSEAFPPPTGTTQITAAGACWLATLCAAILGWPLVDPTAPRHWAISAACLAVSAVATMIIRRRGCAGPIIVIPAVATIGFVCLTAVLALPGGPGLPHLLLAMSGCSATAMLLVHLLRCGTEILIPVSIVATVVGAVIFGAVLNWWSQQLVGPLLAACGLIIITTAPHIAARLAGISTETLGDDLTGRAEAAGNRLTRLICIAAGSAAAGAIFIATNTPPGATSVALTVAVAGKLLLHSRKHGNQQRVRALIASAGVAAAAQICAAAVNAPGSIPWLCLAAGLGTAAILWLLAAEARNVTAAAQLSDSIEFGAAAAAVPLMIWSLGLFTAVRGASFS